MMKQSKLLLILFTLFPIAGQAQIKPDTVTVSFQLVSKSKGEMATFVYPDLIACNNVSLHPVTDGSGRWTVKIPTFHTLHIQIWDDNKIHGVVWNAINLFCRPGTKADILLDDVNDRCVFTGENAEAHQAQLTHPLKLEDFHGRMFNMDVQEAATCIRNIYKQNLLRIDTLCATHPEVPSSYIEGLNAMAHYGYALDMTQNVLGHSIDSLTKFINDGNKLPQEYIDLFYEVKTKDLLHPHGFLSCDAITYFNDLVSIEDIAKNGIIREVEEQKGDFLLNNYKRVCSLIDGIGASEEVTHILKTSQFLEMFQTEMTQEREDFMRSQLTADAFEKFQIYLNGMTTKYEVVSEEEINTLAETPIGSLVNGKDIFQKLIAPYRGQVIYIDVWGTWCGPCMREMEHVSQLHAALEGLPVTYMYLANKSPEELWQKTAKRFGLDGKDCLNLRLPDNQQHAVEDYLGVRGFPTFLIVAPDGTIATQGAPRPSEPSAVRAAIMKLMEK